MLEILRKRRDEEGFTLIELMVVVLIIAILIAIAIPTFLGARARAQDRAAQSNLRNAFTAEKTFYTDSQAYTATAASLSAIEPAISFQTSSGSLSATGNQVSVLVGDVSTGATIASGVVCMNAKSASGTTFGMKDVSGGTNAGTYYSKTAITTCDDSKTGLTSSW
jgi:type IV pilus assembly protein PilA